MGVDGLIRKLFLCLDDCSDRTNFKEYLWINGLLF